MILPPDNERMRIATSRPFGKPAVLLCLVLFALILGGCASGGRSSGPTSSGNPSPARNVPGALTALDPSANYSRAGLLAHGAPMPFVGNVAYFASGSLDSTLVLVTLSLANHALTFSPEGDGYRATYGVTLDVRQGTNTVQHRQSRENVRVASFKETTRVEESVIFQQFVVVTPGQYVLALAVRDEGSTRNAAQEALFVIPRFGARTVSTPVAVYRVTPRQTLDSFPSIVANPRSAVIFGRDTLIDVYVEGYGVGGADRLPLTVLDDKNVPVWRDTITLVQQRSVSTGIVRVPVARIGVGQVTLAVSVPGTGDTMRAPLFVNFSDEFAISSFDELLNYLRFFATPERIRALRDTPPEQRAGAWAAFYRETDPVPSTAEHEALREYFSRLEIANERFREDGSTGWTTDRGRVFTTLGEPDQILEQGENASVSQRGRAQLWIYNQYHLQLYFVDQSGFGRWRMTNSSESDFENAAARQRAH